MGNAATARASAAGKVSEERVFDGAVQGSDGDRRFARAHLPRQHWEQRRSHRYADRPKWQLIDALGVVEQRDGAGWQQTANDDVHCLIELRRPGAHESGRHPAQQQPHLRREARARDAERHARPAHRDHQHDELHHPRD